VRKTGNIYGTDNGSIRFQVLGGPVEICGKSFYTTRSDEGRTILTPDYILNTYGLQGWAPVIRPANVIENWCPECEEDEMIFYSGDYICAWCREHLEQ
jgi:hypothetical protein